MECCWWCFDFSFCPVAIVSNVTDRSFVLSWDSVSRSSYYEVDVSEDANFSSFIGDYGGLAC